MIERLLAADDALGRGELEVAERLFAQVANADGRNAIALVGLARVAARRGDAAAARELLLRALEIDPDEAAAKRLLTELEPERAVAAAAPAEAPPVIEAPAAPRRPSLLDRIRSLLGLSNRRR